MPLLALLALAPPAGAAARCDAPGARTLAASAQARVFSVPGRSAARLFYGCRRGARPRLLARDAAGTANGTFRLAGTWVAWWQTSRGRAELATAATVRVRSLAGARRRVDQDVSRTAIARLVVAADGSVAWVGAADGAFEVDGVAPGARRAVALAVARGIAPGSLALRGGRAVFRQDGRRRRVALRAPDPLPAGDAVGRQGLDARFGDCGTLVPPSPPRGLFTGATQLERAPSGAIVAAGTTTSGGSAADAQQDAFVVTRFSADGRLDGGFNRTGVVQLPVPREPGEQAAQLTAALVLPDEQIVLGGFIEQADATLAVPVLARLNADGSLDRSFGAGGFLRGAILAQRSARIEDLAAGPGGTLLVTGQRDERWFVARLRADGAPDPGFGSGGVVADAGAEPSALAALAVAPDGGIVAAGGVARPLLVRLGPDGARRSATAAGPPATGALRALALLGDGGVAAAGVATNVEGADQLLLARYDAVGRPLAAFGRDGFALDRQVFRPHDLAIAVDGGLLVTADFALAPGRYAGSGIVRFAADGRRDAGFGFRGVLGGTSSYGLDHHELLLDGDGTALVAQANGGAFAVSRLALGEPALSATAGAPSVCAMATATKLAPLVRAKRLDVSLRLRAPGRVRLTATFDAGGRTVTAGSVTVLRPYTEGAIASIPLSKEAVALLRDADAARLTLTAGAPGGAPATYTAAFER